jgi:hypothetical protein
MINPVVFASPHTLDCKASVVGSRDGRHRYGSFSVSHKDGLMCIHRKDPLIEPHGIFVHGYYR